MDNMILYNEYAVANTIRVTGGATLTIGENLTCVPNSNGIYMKIQADAGSTVILNGGIFAAVRETVGRHVDDAHYLRLVEPNSALA